MEYFFPDVGALGNGERISKNTPGQVEALRGTPKLKLLSTGRQYAILVNEKDQVYNWGSGS